MSEEVMTTRSKRTTIKVELNHNTGVAQILVDRDGHRIYQIDVPKEPAEKVGT